MSEGEYSDYQNMKSRCQRLDDEVKALSYDKFHSDAYIGTLHDWIKSDSVYSILRYADKSPSIVHGDDDHYVDLYNLSEQLRAADRADIENRNDAFDQTLP